MSTATETTTTTTNPAPAATTQQNGAAPAATTSAAPAATGGGAQGAGATNAGGTPGTANPASAEWYAGFSDELRGYVANKQFKDPAMMAESYRNLEKLRGVPEDQLVKIGQTPEEQKAMWAKLGTPDKVDAYQIEVPKDAPAAPKEFVDFVKNAALKANMTTEQFKTLMGEWNNQAVTTAKAQADAQLSQSKQEFDGLKAEWGNAYEQKLNVAKAGATEFGLTQADIDGLQATLGYSKTMKLFADIGGKLGEGTYNQGTQPAKNLSVDAAKAAIAVKKSDPSYMAKVMAKDAVAYPEYIKLMQDAFPGTMSVG